MILRTGIIALLVTLCLSGCSATKPVIWKARDVSFSHFRSFEIHPVANATDKIVKNDVMTFLTVFLKEQFQVHNLQLADSRLNKSEVLIVQSDILVYEAHKLVNTSQSFINTTGAARKAQCSLRTRLVDKSTNNLVAVILTVNEVAIGTIGYETHEWILKESAAAVAKEVARIIQDNAVR